MLDVITSEREEKAENALVNAVKAHKGLCFKLKFLGISGAPDRLVLLPGGRFYFVELKRAKGGSLEASQQRLFPLLERLGFTIHVLSGAEQVKTFVSTYLCNPQTEFNPAHSATGCAKPAPEKQLPFAQSNAKRGSRTPP